MKLRNLEITGLVLTILATAALLVFTTPFAALSACRILMLLAAGAFCVSSLLLRCGVWVLLVAAAVPHVEKPGRIPARPAVLLSPEGPADPARRSEFKLPHGMAFAVSAISLIGMLTPMNLGTDVLRSLYGKRYLGIGVRTTAAASILTREFKLHVSLSLAVCLTLCVAWFQASLLKAAVLSVMGLVLILVGFCSLRTDAVGRLTRRLRIGNVSETIGALHKQVGPARKRLIYLTFALAFLMEWLSLHLCFLSLNLNAAFVTTFVVYVILFFLSRTPFLPQGVGAVGKPVHFFCCEPWASQLNRRVPCW